MQGGDGILGIVWGRLMWRKLLMLLGSRLAPLMSPERVRGRREQEVEEQ